MAARRRLLRRLRRAALDALGIAPALDETRVLAARVLIEQTKARGLLDSLRQAEFKVFSQFGDDGIVQYLVHHLRVSPDTFVEFGVDDYRESTTRFLLVNDNWRGLVLDSDPANIAYIRGRSLSWRHDLTAVCAFVDRDNIDQLLVSHGFSGPIGLLAIDIDGNDYWVWERVSAVDPVVVVVEYNSVFGARRAVTIPYDPAFDRTRAHTSHLYWGSSLKALVDLGRRKGYEFVGSNGAGNNAYFVRRDRLGGLVPLSTEDGYVASRFRESRGVRGRLTYLGKEQRREVIAKLPIWDLETSRMIRVADL